MSKQRESNKRVAFEWTHIHKGVTVRFGFDNLRISQIHNYLSRTKQRGRPIGMYCHIYPPISIRLIVFFGKGDFIYIHLRGAFARCSFRQIGQCESLQIVERAIELAPRFFVYNYNLNI